MFDVPKDGQGFVLFLYDFDCIGGNCEKHKDPIDINEDEEVKVHQVS